MAGTSVSNGNSTWAENNASIQSVMDGLGEALTQISAEPSVLDGLLSRFWSSYHALKHRQQDSRLSVAVLALAKSGKSTLLNALVGQELLPMNNVPETARISKIVHTPDAKEPYLVEYATAHSGKAPDMQGNVTARGEAGVRQRLQQLNQAVRERSGPLASLRAQPSHGLSSVPSLGAQRSPSLAISHSGGVAGSPCAQPQLAGSGSGSGSGEGLAGSGSGSLEEGGAQQAEEDAAAVDVSALDLPSPNCPPVATGLPLDRLLTIHAPVAALVEYDHSHAASSSEGGAALGGGVRLQLLDTPGPNEAGEEELKHQVERLLDGVDAVLYLLDYTKLKTQDEAGMFERLRAINPALVSRLSQRLFFVINKVDAALTSEGQDLEQTREYVAELVTQQMGLEGFNLKPDQVLLLSACNALLSRLVLSGKASPEARARFVQLAFGRFANPACITQDLMHTAANALLMDSGVLDVESQVLAYLYNHAAAVKQLALVDDLGRLLVEVGNVARSCTAALSASAEALAARVSEVQAQLAATLAQFEAVQKDADNIAKEVSREVSAHLHLLRGRLFSAIINALDTSGGPDMPAPSQGAAGAGLMTRGWQSVRERFLSIFTGRANTGGSSTNISSGVAYFSSDGGVAGAREDALDRCDSAALLNAAGGMVARSRSKAELASLLLTLHEELTGQIHAEVREFWGVMEAVAAARHAELLNTLNTHLADLARQVEGAVSHSLEVRLKPVQLTLAPPDAAQFHANIDTLLARGVAETRERHIRVNQKEVVERVLRRGGICRWGDYWESVPRVRTVVEAYTLSVYELVPSEISQHFIAMVDSAIDGTQSSLDGYVSQFVGQQLQEARQQLQAYSHSYLGVMSNALEASTQGSQQRLDALAQVCTFTTKVNTVQIQFNNLQHQLSHGVPRALDVMSAYDELSDVCELEEEQAEQQEAEEEQQQEQEEKSEQPEQQEDDDADSGHAGEDEPAPTTPRSPTAAAAAASTQPAVGVASTSMKAASPFAQAAVAAQVFDTAAASTSMVAGDDAAADSTPAPTADPEQPSRAASAGSGTLHMADSPLAVEPEPRSPTSHSDSSSLVNALLQAPLGASPQRVPRTPGTPGTPALTADMEEVPAAAEGAAGSSLSPNAEEGSSDTATAPQAVAEPSSSAISLPSGPFDYASGFINAMSGSQVQAEPAEAAAAAAGVVARAVSVSGSSSEEWDLVDKVEGEEQAVAA